ncbi:tyrosine-type recombinase/integrase [Emticicia sp. W12TSBA100-4]|uniref:site-specific integrase n=1 Tax=Emticicia sp. W12TSBA100-4 TaxID=3160965 RepID=UPI003305EFE8
MKYKLKLLPNNQRIRNGVASIRFYVSANGGHDYINTGVSWSVEDIDTENCVLIRGSASQKQHNEATEKINNLLSKINKVFERDPNTQAKEVKHKLEEKNATTDFIKYSINKAFSRQQTKEITYSTYQTQIASINKVQEYCKVLPFNKISVEWLEGWKAFLIGLGHERNTVWSRLKDIRTYMNLARKEKIVFEYPFGGQFKMPKVENRIEFLFENEFQAIKNYYFSDLPTNPEKVVLRAFLFACYTSLRISDITAIRGKNIKNGNIDFEPIKGKFSETKNIKRLIIPIHEVALNLIGDVKKDTLIFFDLPAEQKINVRLKQIAKKLNIAKDITFHYSRHTFATRFLAHGGSVETLQEIMGHEKIETTMIYVHVEPSRKASQINLLS